MAPYQKDLKAITKTQKFLQGDPLLVEYYYRIIFKTYCYDPEMANLLNLHMTPESFLNGANVYKIFLESVFAQAFDLKSQLQTLKIPTLIIHGDSDVIPHVTAKKIHESIPNSQYILLKECGHFPYVETPKILFEHLNAFLHSSSL